MATPVQDQYRNPQAKIDEWLDGTESGGAPEGYQGDKKKVYARRTVMPDGSVTTIFFERGTFDPATGSDKVIGQEGGTNRDVQQATAADEKEANAQTDVRDEKDPQTGQTIRVTRRRSDNTIIKTEPAPASAAAAAASTPKRGTPYKNAQGQWVRPITNPDGTVTTEPLPREEIPAEDPKDQPTPKRGAPYKNAQGQWVRPITNPDGTVTSEPLPAGEIPAEDPKQTGGTLQQRNGRTYIVKPDGSTVETNLPADVAPKSVTSVKGADGVTYTVAVDAQGNATARPVEGLPANRPAPTERVDPANPRRRQRLNPQTGAWEDAGDVYVEEGTVTVDGKPHRVTRDAQGRPTGLEELPISGGKPIPSSATGWVPDPTKPAYGLAERFRQYSEMEASGTLTRDQAKQLYEQDRAVATTLVSQNNATLQTQSGLYSHGVTQRGQDVDLANTRLNASQSAITSSLSAADKMMLGGEAFKQLVNYYHSQAQKYGGLNDIPREQPGPAMQQVNRMGLQGAPAEYPGAASGAPGTAPAPGAPSQPGTSGGEPVVPPGSPGVPAGEPWLRPPVQPAQPGGAGTVSITIQNGAGQQPQVGQAQAAPQPPGQAYAKMLNQPDPALQQRLTSFQQELDADFQNELTGGGMLAGAMS